MPTLAAVQLSCACTSPDHLDQAIQRELAALASLAAVHRSACRWLDAWSGPEQVKKHLARHIEARHWAEREPHLLRLAELHQHRAAVAPSAPLASTAASSGASVSVEASRPWERVHGSNRKPSGFISLGLA